MREIEEQAIKEIRKSMDLDGIDLLEIEIFLEKFNQEPFNTASTEFINHPLLKAFALKNSIIESLHNPFVLWLRIEEYIRTNNKENLNRIEVALKTCLENMTPEAKAGGTAMLSIYIANSKLIKKLYSLNDKNLSKLFLKYLPTPRAKVFDDHPLPDIIAEREQASTQTIKKILDKNGNVPPSLERTAVKAQRRFRSKKRKDEELHRVSAQYNISTKEAEQLLNDANKPYTPQCEQQLAQRITSATTKIELFSEVKHLTAASALSSIFDDGLYGRRSLLKQYIPFKMASLSEGDIKEGDGNVICFGANGICPLAAHGVELTFNAKKIAKNNPCAFYKQRDLHYKLEKKREINIGELTFSFSHTDRNARKISSFELSDKNSEATSTVKNVFLIAYDLEKMHQILTLNFFRFIDNLDDEAWGKKIYSALDKLDDKELAKTLEQIGKQMTDTMEFNFYGAYQIDFSTLLTIKTNDPPYILHLPDFVNKLKIGNTDKLHEAMKNIPEIFQSHRFIDFLLSVTKNEAVVDELTEQRSKCIMPSWKPSP